MMNIKSFDVFQSLIMAMEEPILQHDFIFNTLEKLTGMKYGNNIMAGTINLVYDYATPGLQGLLAEIRRMITWSTNEANILLS